MATSLMVTQSLCVFAGDIMASGFVWEQLTSSMTGIFSGIQTDGDRGYWHIYNIDDVKDIKISNTNLSPCD